ncbi:MAG TPA: hypothetical protein VNH46_04565, partial [Gemmatimonadales bacterium]|nr:hypothetical protein [Gemmatimonadales bacterium]
MHRPILLLVPLSLLATALTAQAAPARLVEFGWDRPLVSWARQHASQMDSTPFAGVVLQFRSGTRFLTATPLDPATFAADSADLVAFRVPGLTDNFVLVGTTPDSSWNWYDDSAWAVGLANLARFARTARVGGLAGVFLDLEPYGFNPWRYDRQAGRSA